MNKRVLVAVSGPDKEGFLAWQFTRFSLFLSGAKAIRTSPSHPVDLKRVDALIIGGGNDINPKLYKEAKHPKTKNIDYKRDLYELKLIKEAIKLKLPILGICRGMQLLNIYFGGSLYQHIFDLNLKYEHKKTPFAYKRVFIKPKTKLFNIFRKREIIVNSIHHQAIKKLGKGLTINAYDENRIVQGIEHISYPFLIGVQWHPEYMINDLIQRKLFKKLIDFAKNR